MSLTVNNRYAFRISPSTTRVQELPQHAEQEWVSSRTEDRSCSTPAALAMPSYSPSSSTTPDHAGDRPFSLVSNNAKPHDSTKTLSAAVVGMSEGHRGREESARGDEDTESRHENDGEDDGGEECVTLAITTCKRLRAFLGTAEGLQARYSLLPFSNPS